MAFAEFFKYMKDMILRLRKHLGSKEQIIGQRSFLYGYLQVNEITKMTIVNGKIY